MKKENLKLKRGIIYNLKTDDGTLGLLYLGLEEGKPKFQILTAEKGGFKYPTEEELAELKEA